MSLVLPPAIVIESVGLLATALGLASYAQDRLLMLRMLACLSFMLFGVYAVLIEAWSSIVTNAIGSSLLLIKLVQERALIRRIEASRSHVFDLTGLKSRMTPLSVSAGSVILRAGDAAETAYHVVSGRVRVVEAGVDLSAGDFFGEMGLFAQPAHRTATVVAVEDSELLTIGYHDLRTLYMRDPAFGVQLVKLVVQRTTHMPRPVPSPRAGAAAAGPG